jgi:hypothetical protein
MVVLLGIYAGAGLVTLLFQLWIRYGQCAGATSCAISFLKGAVWSTIWPASWVVFLAGLK